MVIRLATAAIVVAMSSLFSLQAVQATSLDISLADETAQFTYLLNSDIKIGAGGVDFGFGFLYNDNDDFMTTLSMLVTGDIRGTNKSIQVAAGLKTYIAELDRTGDDSASALGLGGKLSYIIPSSTPMAIYLEGYISPEITSFGDNDSFAEMAIGYEIEVAPSAKLYIGHRKIETELQEGGPDYEIDDSTHLGLRLSF